MNIKQQYLAAVFDDLLLKSDINGLPSAVLLKAEKPINEEEKERARRFTLGKPLHKVSVDEKPESQQDTIGIHSYSFIQVGTTQFR